jgi:hypothetical protein
MKKRKRKEKDADRIEMCLCAACASSFYNTPGNRIKRKNPKQKSRDICNFCNYRYGYDYLVKFAPSDVQNGRKSINRTMDKTGENRYSHSVGQYFPLKSIFSGDV